MIHGKNIPLDLEGKVKLYGFYTHRYVKAKNKEDAKTIAITLVMKEIEKISSAASDAVFEVEEIVELASFGKALVPGKGFAFFPEDIL